MPPEEDVLPTEEQPMSAAISPTADSSRYIPEFDPEEDPEEDPADYPTNRDDDDENEEEESSKDEADDDEEDEDEEEEEEHPALADFIPHLYTVLRTGCLLKVEAPSPSHPLPSSTPRSGTPPLLPIPLPTSSPPLLLPFMSHRAYVLEVTLPPQKRLCIALGLRFKVGKSSSAPTARPTRGYRADYGFVGTLDDEIRRDPEREVGYGITDTWDKMVKDMLGIQASTNVAGLSQRMTNFVTTVRQDTDEIYERLDDAQDDRLLMRGQLNMLRRDRRTHARTAKLIESEARLSREAWVQSMDVSDTARAKVMSLHTTVLAQESEIAGLRATDRTRQTQLAEAITLLKTLQTQMAAVQRRRGPARGPTHPKASEEAGSSS
nr:hypothetical protein [Tanacetum cinerariifolium]